MIYTILFAKEQYIIPGKKCIDHIINRCFLFDRIGYKKKLQYILSGLEILLQQSSTFASLPCNEGFWNAL